MDLIARRELHNPSLREIGRALEIEPAHILYYFSSREDLLQNVIMAWDDQARSARLDSTESIESLAEQLRHNISIPGIVHLYLSFAAEAVDPQHPAHDYFQQRFERVRQTLETRIRKEQDQGTIPPTIDPVVKARQLVALADGLQLQSLVNPSVNAADDLLDAIESLRQPGRTR